MPLPLSSVYILYGERLLIFTDKGSDVMEVSPKNSIKQKGVSIITCTNRQSHIRNLFNNYIRQRHPKKELIIIVNDNKIPLSPYRQLAHKLRAATLPSSMMMIITLPTI